MRDVTNHPLYGSHQKHISTVEFLFFLDVVPSCIFLEPFLKFNTVLDAGVLQITLKPEQKLPILLIVK